MKEVEVHIKKDTNGSSDYLVSRQLNMSELRAAGESVFVVFNLSELGPC